MCVMCMLMQRSRPMSIEPFDRPKLIRRKFIVHCTRLCAWRSINNVRWIYFYFFPSTSSSSASIILYSIRRHPVHSEPLYSWNGTKNARLTALYCVWATSCWALSAPSSFILTDEKTAEQITKRRERKKKKPIRILPDTHNSTSAADQGPEHTPACR